MTIRSAAMYLPIGKRNQVINRVDRIQMVMRRAKVDTRTPEQMSDSIVDRHSTTKRIVEALIAGRELSYKDMKEFNTVEWHSRICDAKSMIEKRFPGYVFCSRWETSDKHPYKIYWLENVTV